MIVNYGPQTGDVIAVAQKAVSKAEGRTVRLSSVTPSREALELSQRIDKDPRIVELVLRESVKILRAQPGLLIVEHRLGFVMANAGIDASNVGGDDRVILLPENPDQSARNLASNIERRSGAKVGIVITDSWGRPWRLGTVGFAIGLAGLPGVVDMCGEPDLDGRPLQATAIGIADEIAAAASLVMGQAAEGQPVVVVRGLPSYANTQDASDIIRPPDDDLFR